MKVLLAVDGSDYTKRMLGYLMAHDEWLVRDHTIEAITAVPQLPARAAAMLGHETVEAYYTEEAERVFAPIRQFFAQQTVKAEFVAVRGPAADAIARHATAGRFDLLVMGSHGHGAVTGLVMGSVATRVLSQCKVPVLLVR